MGVPVLNQVDHIAMPMKLTNHAGELVHDREAEVFGEVSSGGMVDQLRYPGQLASEEIGYGYNLFRYLNFKTGRYLRSDPLGLRGGMTLYAYASNSPTNKYDPFGLKAKFCCKPVGGMDFRFTFRSREIRIAGEATTHTPRVDFDLTPNHCYIRDDERAWGYSLFREEGHYFLGRTSRDDARDLSYPGNREKCEKCSQPDLKPCEDPKDCFEAAHKNYPHVSLYGTVIQNSNTYAGTLARSCCKGGVPEGFGGWPWSSVWAPGINDDPAGPVRPPPLVEHPYRGSPGRM